MISILAIVAAVSATQPCTGSTLVQGRGQTTVVKGNCAIPPNLEGIIRELKNRTIIEKTVDQLPQPVAPPVAVPTADKPKAEPVKAKPKPKVKAKPKKKRNVARNDRCGSKRAVWYTAKGGHKRYRCR